jgi:hypothetical protein
MDINIVWESQESVSSAKDIKLKEFLNSYSESLKDQIVEQDYQLKFNNNSLNKILMNNQLGDLVNKFHGSKIIVTPTKDSLEEIENLKIQINEKKSKLEAMNEKIRNAKIEALKEISVSVLEKKFLSLLKHYDDTNTNTYYMKIKEKIFESLKFLDVYILEEKHNAELHLRFINQTVEKIVPLFTKIFLDSFAKIQDFIYKNGALFVNNKEALNKLVEAYLIVQSRLWDKIIEDTKKSNEIENIAKNNPNILKEFLDRSLPKYFFEYRYLREPDRDTSTFKFYSFEDPVKVNISEAEFVEIKNLLSQYPSVPQFSENPNNIRKHIREALSLILERNIHIYLNYGIKMEEFFYASFIYNK